MKPSYIKLHARDSQSIRARTASRSRNSRVSRKHCAKHLSSAGTPDAERCAMAKPSSIESWTIPLHVIMWATLLCGLIMTIVVVLKN
jgi:hypothetical protein